MASSTRRTAGCGPACPVVWQGRVGDHSPYADCQAYFGGLRLSEVEYGLRMGNVPASVIEWKVRSSAE